MKRRRRRIEYSMGESGRITFFFMGARIYQGKFLEYTLVFGSTRLVPETLWAPILDHRFLISRI